MKVRPTPKFGVVLVVTLLAIGSAVASGHSDVIALVTPAVMAAAIGLTRPQPQAPIVDVHLETERCFEGDEIGIAVEVRAPLGTEVEVAIKHPPALRPIDGEETVVIAAEPGRAVARRMRFTVERWGAHRLGPLAIRTYGSDGFVVREEIREHDALLKAFPAGAWLERPLSPHDTNAFSGNYVSRRSGEGIEFSNVRPFTSGDSIKRINWKVTSRRGSIHVNLWHPERNAEVMLFLDTFSDIGVPGRSTLDLTVRGASTVARRYLRDKDRVGLVSFGGAIRWITSSMGKTQIYRITDFLLDTSATFSYVWKGVDVLPPRSLPPNAFVFAFTPMVDERFLGALNDLHGRGYPVVVVNTLHEADVHALDSVEDRLAHRVWKLHRRSVRWGLIESGIPVIDMEHESIEAGLARLERGRELRKLAHR